MAQQTTKEIAMKFSDFTPEDQAKMEACLKANTEKYKDYKGIPLIPQSEAKRLRKEQEEARLAAMSPGERRRGDDYFGWFSGQVLIGFLLLWHPLTMALWAVIATLMAIYYGVKYDDILAGLWVIFVVGVAFVFGVWL